jgi:dipeptidase
MEIIGKGEYELGAVWVAIKVPKGHVCGHANQARIRTFPLNDPENCLYASDTISFAKKIGLYDKTKLDHEFSFTDAYDPVSFFGIRFCEARVYSFYSAVMGSEWSLQYLDYIQGKNESNHLPLFVKPVNNKKISVADAMQYMRSHYENTALDMSGNTFSDVGAGSDLSPNRVRPLTWESGTGTNKKTFFHERPIATQQTGWNFVAQSRRWLPRELAGLLWFGVDDSSVTVHFPIYGSSTKVPESFAGLGIQDGVVPPMMQFSFDSAFYVFNLVANWAYSRWSVIYPDVYKLILQKEYDFQQDILNVDKVALRIYNEKGASNAIEYVTNFSVDAGNKLVKDWLVFFGQLFVKYRDGYVITENKNELSCGCDAASAAYSNNWYDRIVSENGDHYMFVEDTVVVDDDGKKNLKPISKIELLKKF